MMQLKLVWLDALRGLTVQRLRTGISLGAIALTMVAFLLVTNLKYAVQERMEEVIAAIGPNTLHAWVVAPPGSAAQIKIKDIDRLKTPHHPLNIYPYLTTEKKGGTGQLRLTVVASQVELLHHLNFHPQGIGLLSHQNRQSVSVGHALAHQLSLALKDTLWINTNGYHILNIFEPVTPNPLFNFDLNQAAYISFDEIIDEIDSVDTFLVTYPQGMTKQEAKKTFEFLIKALYGSFHFQYRDDDFVTYGFKQSLSMTQTVLGWFAIVATLMGLVAIVSQQWMAFLDRRGECGMRLCLGATKTSLFILFLAESCWLGVAGTVLGFILGLGALAALYHYLGWAWSLVWGVSGLIGLGCFMLAIISGVIPAILAANTKPARLLLCHS